jgi:prepilin-type N-terminal cleavage/methylation domain-containing protein
MRSTLGKRNGFTLIELLVVIGVIALLMAMLVPVLERVRNQARAAVCQSNLHQCGILFQILTNEDEDRFAWDRPDKECSFDPLREYSGHFDECLHCPLAKDKNPKNIIGSTYEAWWCGIHPEHTGSYGLNTWCNSVDSNNPSPKPVEWQWTRIDQQNADKIPVLLDCISPIAWPRDTDAPPPYEGGVSGTWYNMPSFCIDRHNGGINGLFMNWSVRKIGLKELWTLKWHRKFDTSNSWTRAGGAGADDWPDWMQKYPDY